MLARCLSASLQGLDARPVTVEVDMAPGLPGIQLVGLPDKAIQESRERVRSALRNSGFRGPLVRVVINLAPADLRKEGPAFDLPIALALLAASGQLDQPRLRNIWCAGELGLDGSLRPCRGVIALAELASDQGARALIVPPANAEEAALIPELTVLSAPDLRQVVEQLQQRGPLLRTMTMPRSTAFEAPEPEPLAQPGVEQSLAARALALAAAGGHHLLLVGPPGCGKTHLAPAAQATAAPQPERSPHHHADPIGGRPAAQSRHPSQNTAVPGAPSQLYRRCTARRRHQSAAGGAQPRPRRRAVSRRAGGIFPGRARPTAATPGGGRAAAAATTVAPSRRR